MLRKSQLDQEVANLFNNKIAKISLEIFIKKVFCVIFIL